MKKDIDYYMGLPYTIEVVSIPDDEGGGFTARLPEVGRFAITGDGETPKEAIDNLRKVQRERFEEYLEKGLEIPEPQAEKEEYSGRFVVRLPKILHRQLAQEAKENGISLNQYVIYLLSYNFQAHRQHKIFDKLLSEIKTVGDALWEVHSTGRLYNVSEVSRRTKEKKRGALVITLPDPDTRKAA